MPDRKGLNARELKLSTANLPLIAYSFHDEQILFEAANEVPPADVDNLCGKNSLVVDWIEQFRQGETFFDIGAQAGAATVLAAKGRKVSVTAFEPEAQQYAMLVRNLSHNKLQNQVNAYCLYLTNQVAVGKFENKQAQPQDAVFWCLDNLVLRGEMQMPSHVKISNEKAALQILEGMAGLLQQKTLQSIYLVLNKSKENAAEVFALLRRNGFVAYEPELEYIIEGQAVALEEAEYLFVRDVNRFKLKHRRIPTAESDLDELQRRAQAHFVNRIETATLIQTPFPYVYIDNIFPQDFYEKLLEMKPSKQQMKSIAETGRTTKHYQNRMSFEFDDEFIASLSGRQRCFVVGLRSWLLGEAVLTSLLTLFHAGIKAQRIKKLVPSTRALFMKDCRGYAIAPHTDVPLRLISAVIYIPSDSNHSHLGTSVYQPIDQQFTCSGEKHHQFDGFKSVDRMPYRPNSAIFFLKTHNSFHGVEPMNEDYERDSICYMVRKYKIETE